MQHEDSNPNAITFGYALKACRVLENIEEAQELHEKIVRGSLLSDLHVGNALLDMYVSCFLLGKTLEVFKEVSQSGGDVRLSTSLVDMYAKCGMMAKAQEVFNLLSRPNIVAWTSLVGGYIEHEKGEKALQCFNAMQQDGIIHDAPAFVLSMKACGIVKGIENSQELHAKLLEVAYF
ncbi:hypothetical protein GOP47_0021249 [Adiantum capillus-veneris]|uniref:Pentatricopeptide repeat-containing protein n=1 Tax=Adiantum capillus-veneris TaxID=13818 RepID=A0A9D4UAR2_ADICA|nr:hypothetical protein GOP47_0021249 [Adiantum capillus-veneris]